MRWQAIAAGLMLLASGCLGTTDEGVDDALLEDDAPVEAEVHFLEGTHRMVVQQVRTPISTSAMGGQNCMALEGVERIENASLVATWNAQSPLAERLEILAAGHEWMRATGTSPLGLSFEGLRPDGNGRIMIMVQTDSPGASVQQQVDLELEITYRGGAGVEPNTDWVCAYSG